MAMIEVLISPQGETTLQTKGFSGSDCLETSRWLELALGLKQSDQKTPEFYKTQETHQQQRQNQ